MAVLIDNEDALDALVSPDEIRAICAAVLDAEGVAREVEVSVTIVDDERMRALNAEWRGIDRVTDVLSFECDPADGSETPAGEPVELGDIVLAPAQIARQAPGFGTAPADECRLMLVHGMLHLLGYDHLEDDEAELMEAREDEILRALAAARGEEFAPVHVSIMTRHACD